MNKTTLKKWLDKNNISLNEEQIFIIVNKLNSYDKIELLELFFDAGIDLADAIEMNNPEVDFKQFMLNLADA